MATIVKCDDKLRVQFDRNIIVSDRLIELPLLLLSESSGVVDTWVVRIESDGDGVVVHRRFKVSEIETDIPTIQISAGVSRSQFDGLRIVGQSSSPITF